MSDDGIYIGNIGDDGENANWIKWADGGEFVPPAAPELNRQLVALLAEAVLPLVREALAAEVAPAALPDDDGWGSDEAGFDIEAGW